MNNYKSYSELQEELGENYPFKLYEMGISALKEIETLQQEFQRKDNIINELKNYLEHKIEKWQDVSGVWSKAQVQEDKIILDKMNELESEGD